MKLSQARIYGGIGAILGLVGGVVPYAGDIIAIIGVVLVLVAVKYIAEETKDKSIFTNYLIAFILAIVSIIVAIIALFAFLGTSALFHFSGIKEAAHLFSLKRLLPGVIAAIIIFWVLYLISAIFVKNCYYRFSQASRQNNKRVFIFYGVENIYLIFSFINFVWLYVFHFNEFNHISNALMHYNSCLGNSSGNEKKAIISSIFAMKMTKKPMKIMRVAAPIR